MYEIIKSVIAAKRYELAEMLTKIDTLWVQGSLTDEQRTELIALAQNNAKVENSVDVMAKLEELDKRVTALEKANETTGDESTEETVEYPEYEAGKWYYNGDTVTFNGQTYTCIAPEGVACVWSPTEYPTYWELVTTEESPEVEESEEEATETTE